MLHLGVGVKVTQGTDLAACASDCADPGQLVDNLLLETGDNLLLEAGTTDILLLEA